MDLPGGLDPVNAAMPIVDAHTHVWRGIPDHPEPAATIVSPASDVSVEVLDEYLSEYGVKRAVVVQPLCCGDDNTYIAGLARGDPDRFAAVCVVDPQSPSAADDLGFWIRQGCRGLRLRLRRPGRGQTLTSSEIAPLCETAAELDAVLSVYADPDHLPEIAAVASQLPTLPIVVDHLAHPDTAAGPRAKSFVALLTLARHERVFIKTSGYHHFSRERYPYRDCWSLFRALFEAFGPTRLIWGSDFPHVLLECGYRRSLLLHGRCHAYLSHSDLEAIMGGNASALYWPERSTSWKAP